jgi:hypothetical protein
VLLGSFLGVDWWPPGDWDWTAIGTILLALATFALAQQNRTLVQASREELAETRSDVAIAKQQAGTARRALAAQTQPLLSSVAQESRHPEDISAKFDEKTGGHIAVPFRNIGNGVAVIKQVMFWTGDSGSAGKATDAAVPPREDSLARLGLEPTNRFGPDVVLAERNFSVVIVYADATDQNRGATRLDIHRDAHYPLWYVGQVHFGDDEESVRLNPRTSSDDTSI